MLYFPPSSSRWEDSEYCEPAAEMNHDAVKGRVPLDDCGERPLAAADGCGAMDTGALVPSDRQVRRSKRERGKDHQAGERRRGEELPAGQGRGDGRAGGGHDTIVPRAAAPRAV